MSGESKFLTLMLLQQGGPGLSGTGYGNFQIIGPLDLDIRKRETSWVSELLVISIQKATVEHKQSEHQ